MGKCIFDGSEFYSGKYHCALHRAWIARGECNECPDYREEDMNNKELVRQYNLAVKEERYQDANNLLQQLLKYRPRVIDPDWKDTIEEFNRRLSNG